MGEDYPRIDLPGGFLEVEEVLRGDLAFDHAAILSDGLDSQRAT